ncbi:hypothetical protein JCM11641_002434 [Rhodosporidiobolus odoratus]
MLLGLTLPSRRQGISIFKGVLAYTLAFILIFLRGFNRLGDYPVTLTGIVLITIAGQPGLSCGACWDQVILGALGVGVGSACFAILAKLGHSQVAQGFVLAIFVYFLALVKAKGLRYFAFSLLAILLAFSGIYTSVLPTSNRSFIPEFLESYIEAYCWGFAIVLFVNGFIFPHTSEKELRELLVISLEHISTFSHLIAKTYSLEITDDERKARDDLNLTIRADMGLLNQKLAQAGIEINYSRWSMQDYAFAVSKLRAMQQGLITSYSSLIAMERYDPKALELIKQELQSTAASRQFNRLRRATDLSFADIVAEYAVGQVQYRSPAPGEHSWSDFRDEHETTDVEAAQSRPRALSRVQSGAEQARLAHLRTKLREEVATAGSTPMGSRRASVSGAPGTALNSNLAQETTEALSGRLSGQKSEVNDKVAFLRECWNIFKTGQLAAIEHLLVQVPHEAELRLHRPGLSMQEQYLNPPAIFNPRATTTATQPSRTAAAQRSTSKGSEASSGDEEKPIPPTSTSETVGTAAMRIFSFIAGMGQVADELCALYEHVVPKPGEPPKKKALRFHAFEKKTRPTSKDDKAPKITLREALARLSGRDFTPKKLNLWQYIAQLEKLLRTDTSLYALKTSAAVSVYAVFLLAPSLRDFFVNYGLTSGIITIVVALAPTLGQTFLTFVLQILGVGPNESRLTIALFGKIIGLIILMIFKDVGSYVFNPYGVVCLLALVAIPFQAIIYCRPQFFAGGLLALNSAGVLIVTEWVYREVPGWIRPNFDSPALRAGKQLVAMCIALAIAGIFQGFILRTPARQTLRKKLANVCWSLSAQSVLSSYVMEALMPMTEDSMNHPEPDWDALAVVRTELIARETIIQNELLGLMPLMKFSMAEPSFGSPFKAATISRVIRAHQLILDRLREARTAIGADGFSPEIRHNFSDVLVPYRRQGKRMSRALFYLTATSLSTKQPLPSELPSMVSTTRNIQHDAIVLSHRLAQTEEGRKIVNSQVYLRYWHFLVSFSSIAYFLEGMEADLRDLFGAVEDSPFVADAKAEASF